VTPAVLLDECVPFDLRELLGGDTVFTCRFMKWNGLRDPDMLRRAAQRFDIVITCDKGLPSQRPSGVNLAIIVLTPCRYEYMKPGLPRIRAAIEAAEPGRDVVIDFRSEA
jgi:hypothetical protein